MTDQPSGPQEVKGGSPARSKKSVREVVTELAALGILTVVAGIAYWARGQEARIDELERKVTEMASENDKLNALTYRVNSLGVWIGPICEERGGTFDFGSLHCSLGPVKGPRRSK